MYKISVNYETSHTVAIEVDDTFRTLEIKTLKKCGGHSLMPLISRYPFAVVRIMSLPSGTQKPNRC